VQQLLEWKSNKNYTFGEWICSLRYLACKEHVYYYIVICGVQLYDIFPHYFIKGKTFEKKKSY